MQIKSLKILLFTDMVLLLLIFSIFLTLIALHQNKQREPHPFVISLKKNINEILNQYFYQPLRYCDQIIENVLQTKFAFNRREYLNRILSRIYNHTILTHQQQKINFYLLIYFFIKYVIKLIIGILFILDVFYFNKLHYLYFGLPFLILPLLLRYNIYLCFKYHDTTIATLDKNLLIYNVLELDNPNNTEELIIIKVPDYLNVMVPYHLKGEKNPFEDDIDLSHHYFDIEFQKEQTIYSTILIASKHYIQLLYDTEKIHLVQNQFKTIDQRYQLKLNLIQDSCYFSGSLFILICIIHNIFPGYIPFLTVLEEPFSGLYLDIKNSNWFNL